MNAITLKNYQQEALDAVKGKFDAGVSSQLIVLPTGTGKTYLMAALAKVYNARTLILAHREELITQTYDKIKRYWPSADVGICKASRNETDHQIVIGSVQTCFQKKRLEQLQQRGFRVIMIDEAHHSSADSYQSIINAIKAKNSDVLLIGVTATPERNDRNGLADTYQEIVYSKDISWMIDNGYLCQVFGRKILTTTSLEGVQTYAGDFVVRQLSQAINTSERNSFIVAKFIEHAHNRKAIAFCADVKHTHDLAQAFNDQGIKAAAVWGAMPLEDRQRVLIELRSGTLQVLTSCGVLTEGYDEESIECVIMARPTKSKSLYIQCVGRGLRLPTDPQNTKQDCLVLDFTDTHHNLKSIMTLGATIPELPMIDVVKKEESLLIEELHADGDDTKTELLSDEFFNVLGKTDCAWITIGDGEYSLMDDNNQEIVIRPLDDGYVADICENEFPVPLITQPMPLEHCKKACEDFAHANLSLTYADLNSSWIKSSYKQQPTPGQIGYLSKNHINHDGMDRVLASMAIRQAIALKNKQRRMRRHEPATDKQVAFLKHVGINGENLSKLQAMRTISAIKTDKK